MAFPATQIRRGMVLVFEGDPCRVVEFRHHTPGNLRAMVQAKLKNLRTGSSFEHRFRAADAIEKADMETHELEFLYQGGDTYHFMNTENYEQLEMDLDAAYANAGKRGFKPVPLKAQVSASLKSRITEKTSRNVSAVMTSLGGVLYAQYQLYINPETVSGIGISLQMVFGVIAGGLFVAVTLLFLTPYLYHLPKATLGVIILLLQIGLETRRREVDQRQEAGTDQD